LGGGGGDGRGKRGVIRILINIYYFNQMIKEITKIRQSSQANKVVNVKCFEKGIHNFS